HIIKSTTSAKLLGVHIDRELRWKEQGASALCKGQPWLVQVGHLARASRGIRAGPMHQFYLAMCVPCMLYAADIFLNPHTFKSRQSANRAILAKLRTIRWQATLAITGALSTTPTDVLDAHANLLPVRFLVERTRHRAALHLATLPATHPLHRNVADAARKPVKEYRTPLHDLAAEFGIRPTTMEKIAAVRFEPEWSLALTVSIRNSKDEAEEEEKKDKARWKVYTDGSGVDGMIGAAAVLHRDGAEVRSSRLRLGPDTDH
ncbi:hypothetical protein C8R45DRAFT_765675, partial [Mycena sanguinolenta]